MKSNYESCETYTRDAFVKASCTSQIWYLHKKCPGISIVYKNGMLWLDGEFFEWKDLTDRIKKEIAESELEIHGVLWWQGRETYTMEEARDAVARKSGWMRFVVYDIPSYEGIYTERMIWFREKAKHLGRWMKMVQVIRIIAMENIQGNPLIHTQWTNLYERLYTNASVWYGVYLRNNKSKLFFRNDKGDTKCAIQPIKRRRAGSEETVTADKRRSCDSCDTNEESCGEKK